MASERCWEVHTKCCITGTKGIAGSKPKDIVSMHIWQHAYQDEVCPLFSICEWDSSFFSGLQAVLRGYALTTGPTAKIVMNTLAGTTSAASIIWHLSDPIFMNYLMPLR